MDIFYMRKAFYIIGLLFLLASCRSYYDVVQSYHQHLDQNDFKGAENQLKKSRFLKKKRNQILLCLELGKTMHLQADYDSSNYYLNKADLLMDEKTVVGDVSASVLVNEAMTRYKGEDFERVLIHYYKALNYLYLNQPDEALVEAKRINLRLNELSDKQIFSGRRYKSDALAQILMGWVYEKQNNYNDAFIAYRNAIELYTKNDSTEYMGAAIPEQLKIDLINAADKSGFYPERDEYCRRFNMPFESVRDTSRSSLVFIWENGLAPIKQQEDIFLFLVKGAGGVLTFTDKSGTINIPVILPDDKKDQASKLSDFNTIRVSFPKYVDVPVYYTNLRITHDSSTYVPQLAENVAYIARVNLKERFLKEMTYTTSRIVLRKLAEAEIKKQNELAGALFDVAGLVVEKADTRNWQSLPSQISYTRIPLTPNSTNTLNLQLNSMNGPSKTDAIRVDAKSRLQFLDYHTLQHLPPLIVR
ncbi:MAG: hypothetical protein JST26_12355 [Bacteroidetes bacterium]|nr:hypothetical protein [Bacteroidota bacterium]